VKKSKKSKPMLRPQPNSPGMLEIKGGDVIEVILLAADPEARSKDPLLVAAKVVAGYAKAGHFSDSHLRGVSWFAHLPEVSANWHRQVFDFRNFYASSFWAAWKRDPATVLRLTQLIRARLGQAEDKAAITSHLTKYSDTKAARWKRGQRAPRRSKAAEHIEKFAAKLRNTS